MVAGVRGVREPQHRPRCLARSRRFRWSGGASVGRAIVRGRCGALKSTVGCSAGQPHGRMRRHHLAHGSLGSIFLQPMWH